MSYRETYYTKFNSELERESFRQRMVAHPYYLSHYVYEQISNTGATHFMICIEMGNYWPNANTKVTGEHIPVRALGETDAPGSEEY